MSYPHSPSSEAISIFALALIALAVSPLPDDLNYALVTGIFQGIFLDFLKLFLETVMIQSLTNAKSFTAKLELITNE